MEIVAEGVEATGAHGPLLRPTSLRARSGRLLLATGEPGSGRTALALVLSGRLRPGGGTVRLDGRTDATALRRAVAIVDAPGITEPENSVPVRDVVAEGLGMARHRSGRRHVRTWLSGHALDEYSSRRFEQLPAFDRTRLLLALAGEGPTTRALILDCPDRHGGDPAGWYSLALHQADRGRAVVALCSPYSAEKLDVTPARVGEDNRTHDDSVNHEPPAHSEDAP